MSNNNGHKMKGLCKSFKFISQIFVVTKDREMEIGFPTDVKHVAHIGWDNQSTNAPSWMNEFRTASEFSNTSLSLGDAKDINRVSGTTWGSQDFEQSMIQPEFVRDSSVPTPSDIPKAPSSKKHKKVKKNKLSSTNSPRSSSNSPSARSSSSSSRLASKTRSTTLMATVQM
ncbi:hypothetical protein C5167_019178 [Papaver somniferum]|uniref:CRIB domain-containing protein n=1 Tax=Papaver somniferum TaxID=3469 RepID=A0A4Y7IRI8_PAPSO|nr:CRIB domain-containing protein RIC10-like [Papaver somniferum]XP_026453058.1 CRIB domain-containing protein RIC10-like [Papaver somniferum]RZC50746.1 hypothetical protein C5167_019178 [Papaver somniferum]